MRDFIVKKLEGMLNPAERAVLRELMNDVFMPMYEESERKYAALEQKVRDELPFLYDAYTVYHTVMPREQVDGHPFLSPMLPEEAHESEINAWDLAKTLHGGTAPVIETVFYEADFLQCQQIIGDTRSG